MRRQPLYALAAPLLTYVLHIDRQVQGVQLQVGQALDVVSYGGTAQGRETMSHMAARTGAVAAINGDFFPFNTPSDGRERPVANGLLIFANPQKAADQNLPTAP